MTSSSSYCSTVHSDYLCLCLPPDEMCSSEAGLRRRDRKWWLDGAVGQERGGLGGEERGLGAVVRRQRRDRCDVLRGWCVGLDGEEQRREVELGTSGGARSVSSSGSDAYIHNRWLRGISFGSGNYEFHIPRASSRRRSRSCLPERLAAIAVEFYKRNDRSSLVLPMKVSEMLAKGMKV